MALAEGLPALRSRSGVGGLLATVQHSRVTAGHPAAGQVDPENYADTGIVLSSAQTGNGDSTNILDRGGLPGVAVVQLTSAVGATPTVTVNIQGSMDGVFWYNVPYVTAAAPTSAVVTALTITTAVTNVYKVTGVWRYLKLAYSANTNVTLTATVYLADVPALAI